MTREGRRLAQRRNELVVHMIDLDRREPQPRETGRRTRLTQQAGERVPGLAVAITAEVDPGQHHLAVALCDPAPDLGEHGLRAAAAGAAAHERDNTEVAREATAVLHLDEGANAGVCSLGRTTTLTFAGMPANASRPRLAPQPVT